MKTEDFIKDEIKFCESIDCERDSNGRFTYTSINGASKMILPFVLSEYKDWLIENNIVKLLK